MLKRISIDPAVCTGRPVIKGTRIAAQTVLEFLAAGDTVDDVLAEYTNITREDVQACLAYATKIIRNNSSVVTVARTDF